MTTDDIVRAPAANEPGYRDHHSDVLKRLQDSVLGMLAGLDRPPTSLRVAAGQAEIHLHWPEERAPAPAAAPPSPDGPGRAAPDGALRPVAVLAPAPAADGVPVQYLTAQLVGTFYRSPEPNAAPFVEAGGAVEAGQQVGIIEAMKLMIPVAAEIGGRIVSVLVADGAPVEYGEKLFSIEPVDG